MRHLHLGALPQSSYKIAILVNQIKRDEILKAYVTPYGLNPDDIMVLTLHQSIGSKKVPAKEQKAWITEELGPILKDLRITHLVVTDGEYFKTFTKSPKVDPMVGYVLPTEFGPWNIVYAPNYKTLIYDPEKNGAKIKAGMLALRDHMTDTYAPPGTGIIKFAAYPETVKDISDWLDRLIEMDCPLAIDIEAFGLKHYNAGIGTIGFAWSQSEGIAFAVDYCPLKTDKAPYGVNRKNMIVRELLLKFFMRLKRKAIYHSISYDVTVLIYQLFMSHIKDQIGLLNGLKVMLQNWDCTKLISYLATNSTAGNKLSLKDQAQEFAGDYAQEEIEDITKIPLKQLLQYNLVDCLSTWYVYNKNTPIMDADDQRNIYETIFKPATLDIVQMQLTGMPVHMGRVLEVEDILTILHEDAKQRIMSSPDVKAFHNVLAQQWVRKRNQELKVKRVTVADFKDEFNPNSDPQLQQLLHMEMGLPVLDRTATKAPATGGKTLAKLVNHAKSQDAKDMLTALIEFKALSTVLETFIPALKSAQEDRNGWHWLFGNFNLGGTVSGRLSSSGPNLQNIPSNVTMKLKQEVIDLVPLLKKFSKKGEVSLGKLIKYCFVAPPGWFFCGIDFASLEDRISALVTKDPNKLKVYEDGYDGHSLRAYAYFGDQMTGIVDGDVASINSIQTLYPAFRQDSKTPTFLLTYGGTYIGIMEQLGWAEEKARSVEARYHELYKVSDDYVRSKLDQACRDGYITVAFGLRVRTPLLYQTILGTSKTPFQAEAEGRTAGNAIGQSWCLLNSRAMTEFMEHVRIGALREDIMPCAQIHDANYVLVRDHIDVIKYTNKFLVQACEWQNHPDIAHPTVGLGGEFSIFYPDWSNDIGIPNGADEEQIYSAFSAGLSKFM